MNRTLLIPILILLLSCSGDPGSDPDTTGAGDLTGDLEPDSGNPLPEDFYEAELFPTTKVLDSDNLDQVVSVRWDEGGIQFTGDSPFAADLQVHDVILAGVSERFPQGFLGMVVRIDQEAGGPVVFTEPCGVELAFKSLNVSFTRRVSLGSVESTPAALARGDGLEVLRQPVGLDPVNFDYFVFNGDKDPATLEDQVRVQGTVYGTIDYYFGMHVSWPKILTWPPDVVPEVEVGFNVSAAAGISVDMTGMASRDFSQKDEIYNKDLTPFNVGILWFFPTIDVEAEVEGGAAGAYSLATGVSASFNVAAEVSSGGSGSLTPPNPDFDYQAPVVTSSMTARARVAVGPDIHLRLFHLAGPIGSLRVFAELNADRDQDPCWTLTGGLDGGIGVDLAAWNLTILEWSRSFGITSTTLGTGECVPNPIFDDNDDLAEPGFTPWAATYEDVCSSYDLDGSWLGLTPTVDGRYLVSGSGQRALMKLDRSGDVLWARTYLAPDQPLSTWLDLTAASEASDTTITAAIADPLGILRLDPEGQVLEAWKPELEYQPPRAAPSLITDPDRSIWVAAPLVTELMGNPDLWIIRLSPEGQVLWSKRWGLDSASEAPTAMIRYGDGVVIAGRIFDTAQTPSGRSFVLRLDGNGDQVWAREISGCESMDDLILRTLSESHDGDLITGGRMRTSEPRTLLMKFKPGGDLTWTNGARGSFLGPEPTSFIQLSDGSYLVAGTWWTAGIDRIWLGRTDSVGRFLWMKRYSDGLDNATPGLVLTPEAGVLMAAYSGGGKDHHNLWALRLPTRDGELDLPPGTGVQVEDMTWTDTPDPCLESLPSQVTGTTDFSPEWSSLSVTSQPMTPQATVISGN